MKVKVRVLGLSLLLVVAALLVSATAFAQGEGFFTVSQGDKKVAVRPLENPADAVGFYDFRDSIGHTGKEEMNAAVFFLYKDTLSGAISLFVLLSGPGGTAGTSTLTLSAVPTGADFRVKDDQSDFRDTWQLTVPTGKASNSWDAGKSDGMVIGPLGTRFTLSMIPQFTSGITTAKFLSGALAVPETISLNLVDPIVVEATPNEPPVAQFTVSPTEPRLNQAVTFDASGSSDPNGRIAAYEWDFDGDGIFDRSTTEPRTSYTYTTAGTKTVTLRATDNEGATSRQSLTLVINAVSVKATRTISTDAALPGSTFKVVVRIETDIDLAGAGLQEFLPVGWMIKPIENAGAAFKRAAIQWVFVDQIRAGTTKVISYEVTVPDGGQLLSAALPVCFTFKGIFQALTPSFQLDVEGDDTVEVSSALSIKNAIAHLVPRMGEDTEDTVDLRLSQKIEPHQLARALEMWVNDEPVPWTQGARIDLETMKKLSAYEYTCTPVDLPLPLVPMANVTAVRTIHTPVPCRNVLLNYYGPDGDVAGNTFTVKVEIVADQDLYGVGLREELPTGWRVIPVENGGMTYKPSRVEWVYPSKLPAGTTLIVIYQVEVPQTESIEMTGSDPCYVGGSDVYGNVDAALPCLETPVTGDSAVDVTDCLTVIAAISRWDVERDTIDITLSNIISFQQVQRAVAFWLEDEIVPRTCGHTVDYETLKTIIAYWLTGTDICDPLPPAVRDTCEPEPAPCP